MMTTLYTILEGEQPFNDVDCQNSPIDVPLFEVFVEGLCTLTIRKRDKHIPTSSASFIWGCQGMGLPNSRMGWKMH